jgi:AraC-like DNA-binding protein
VTPGQDGVRPRHGRAAAAHENAYVCLVLSGGGCIRPISPAPSARPVTHTGRAFSEIAERHGFADRAHFTRSFERVTGATPGACRRRRVTP